MNSRSTSFNLHEMINALNKRLPPENHLNIIKLIKHYGNCEDVHHKLEIKVNTRNIRENLEGPIFRLTQTNFWKCTYDLLHIVTFTSIGATKIESEYFSKMTLLLWLDQDHFLKAASKDEDLELPQSIKGAGNDSNEVNATGFSNIVYDGSVSTACARISEKRIGARRVNKIFLNDLIKDTVKKNDLKTPSRIVNDDIKISQNINPFAVDIKFLQNLVFSTVLSNKRICNLNQIRLKSTDVNRDVDSEEPIQFKEDVIRRTTPIALSTNTVNSIYYSDCEESRQITKFYPAPKNILHNIYDQVSRELDKKSFKLTPNYKTVTDHRKSMWICMYHVHWPEEIKFLAKDSKKSVASHKAAVAALSWLKSNEKINKEGLPLLYEKDQIKKLATKTFPIISLDQKTQDYMQNIVNLHEKKVLPHIIKSRSEIDLNSDEMETESTSMDEPDDVNLKSIPRQSYIGLNQYLAKEKVQLPIAPYKEDFIKLLKQNQVIIVKGEPGCGKSTRVPQYVLEAWAKEEGLLGYPGRIAVTQPRRIAAISLAERVCNERNEAIGNIVGYQVRLNSNFRPTTGRILYCTTGILLRHLGSDPKLSKFSHIILDEAHERDVNTDLLMNLLRNAIKTNKQLKLIVMSATIDTNMFSEYFEGAPVMEIPGFTYPVQEHFLENLKKIDMSKTRKMCDGTVPMVIHEDVANIIQYIHENKKEGAILCFLPGWEDISKIQKMFPLNQDIAIYCLHSRLQDSDQWKIFSRPPPGVRKVILATNIAETSVTIDDVVYVVDTGIHKEQRFDIEKGINCVDNHWISKASASQRKGRAGRCQPGECFHLYSRSKYDSFLKYSLPEILRTSLSKIVLDTKVFSNNMNAIEFMRKLPTPPDDSATLRAVNELKDLELLDVKENLTTLGKTVANFQLEPKLSKALVNAVIFKCVTPIVDIVTLFSAETELFVSGLMNKEDVKNVKMQFCRDSDHLAMMRIFEKWLEYSEEGDAYRLKGFCNSVNLVPHKMTTIGKLRNIHFDYLYNGLYDVLPIADDFSDNNELVKAVLFSGVCTVLQHRNWDISKGRLKTNVNVLLTRNNHKATIASESVNFKRYKYPANFLLYINETRSNIRRTTVVRECSLLSNLSVLLFSNSNLEIKEVGRENFSKKIDSDDQVILGIENSKIELLCDRTQAQGLIKCKDAVMSIYRYYINQLTNIGEQNSEVNSSWDQILTLINNILSKNSV